jgi:glycosyltransferase involved in cell wall biosynthesis
MNIFLINHYAGSPKMGMEYRPYYLAKEWIKLGHNVIILVANNSHVRQYNPKMTTNIKEENIDGIKYIWIKTPKYFGNSFQRLLNIFAFTLKTFYYAKYFAEKFNPHVVIASSTYPSDNYVAKRIANFSNAKYIYEVHDLWPLSPKELGGMSRYHPFIMGMQHGENYAYKNADAVVSMLPKTKEHMKSHGLDLSKWHYIPNGIILDEWKNKAKLNKNIKNKILEIKSKFNTTVTYTGTLGLANALYSLVEAGERVKDKGVAIVIIGKGPEKEKLQCYISIKNLNNVFIFESINKQEIPDLLDLFDFLYIGLQYQPLFEFGISPNKLIDYMMAGKPIIQAIKSGNNVVKDVSCGIDIEPENPQAIADAIISLQNTAKEELKQMGINGKEFVINYHDYKVLAKKFLEIIY